MPRPTVSAAWQALQDHRQQIAATPLTELFSADAERAQRLSVEAAGLFLDYSKQPVTAETLQLLLQLAQDAELRTQIPRLMEGDKLNLSEGRAAWHTALRAGGTAPAEVQQELRRMAEFCQAVRDGTWRGSGGEAITDVVNIGIGGSDLGPRMVCHALRGQMVSGPRVHFVANADGAELALVLKALNPATTLFIIASKSFRTVETHANGAAAMQWLQNAGCGGTALSRHVVTVSANPGAATGLGLPEGNGFAIWDWVGGRYSLWSAVGLGIALALGMSVFEQLLEGAAEMDAHFASAELLHNMPVLLALLGIWQRNFLGIGQQVILPYTHYLEYLPNYLQQLEMESNGKRVDRDGRIVDYATGASIWGQTGTNGQHAFLQWLQQGSATIPVDFILPLEVPLQPPEQQRFQVASCLAQSAALMEGHNPQALTPEDAIQRQLPGNRPSSTIVMPRLDARSLGALLALYEHKVFVQAVIWHINPFDQWGVEFGKQSAHRLMSELETGEVAEHDPSTLMLARRFLQALERDT